MTGKPKSEVEGLYRVEVLAKCFGVSARRIHQLVQDGILTTKGPGCYDLVENVTLYIQYLNNKYSGKEKAADLNKLLEQKLRAEIALKEAQGELHEMKNEIAKGTYIEREEAKLEYGRFFLMFKKFALSIPSRVAGRISGRLEPIEVREVENDIQDEITRLLNAFVIAGVSDGSDAKPTINLPKRGRPKKK